MADRSTALISTRIQGGEIRSLNVRVRRTDEVTLSLAAKTINAGPAVELRFESAEHVADVIGELAAHADVHTPLLKLALAYLVRETASMPALLHDLLYRAETLSRDEGALFTHLHTTLEQHYAVHAAAAASLAQVG